MAQVVKKGSSQVPLTIEFSVEELQAITDVLICVGGDPVKSRRGIIDNINKLLRDNGYYWNEDDLDKPSRLYFKDTI